MKDSYKLLCDSVAAVIAGREVVFSPDAEFDWEEFFDLAKAHSIAGLIAYALPKIPAMPKDVQDKFRKEQLLNIFKGTNQETRIGAVLAEFEKSGIEAMPLKGYIMKNYYPSADMRSMCDVDILIKTDRYDDAKAIMEKYGLKFKLESAHEFVFTDKEVITVELHKTLVPDYNRDLFAYYGDGWRLAKKKEDSEHIYEMSAEDFYVYNVVHAAKHYQKTGIGVRQVADIWILEQKFDFSDEAKHYIKEQLEKLGIAEFRDNISALSKVWFEGAESTGLLDTMSEYILSGGNFGKIERLEVSEIYTSSGDGGYKSAKIKRIFRLFFPTLKNMKLMYPVLNKAPVLYPVYIVIRAAEKLLFKRKKVLNTMQKQSVDTDAISEFARHCESVGLKKSL